MADEVIIEEYQTFDTGIPIATQPTTTQVLDIGVASAEMSSTTQYVRIRSKGTGFWYKFGGSDVDAVADTNGNLWLPADDFVDHKVGRGIYIDTVADA